MKQINTIGNVALILVIAIIIFLLPDFSGYLSLLNQQNQEAHIQDAYVEQKQERISTMKRSVEDLNIKDSSLRGCIENQARDRASVDPRSTGGRYIASELDTLTCPGLGIKKLDGLEGMTQLKSLSLFHNEITDLEPLSKLHKLEQLDVSDNRISDISPLVNLPNLTDLNLGGNKINEIRILGEIPKLTNLILPDLQSILCADLDYLKTLPFLSRNNNLYVYNCKGRMGPRMRQILTKDRSEWTLQEEEEYLLYELNEWKKKRYKSKP
jgi:Leucine-rich repeat (LRR) protein